MRVSQKAEYAVRAILDLALHAPPNRGVRSQEIARRTGVPKKFLEAILLHLRNGGLVSSKRGPDGGHWLARDPARVTVGAVLVAIDGPLADASRNARRSSSTADLCVEALWGKVAAAVQGVVDAVTIEDLRRQADARGTVDFSI